MEPTSPGSGEVHAHLSSQPDKGEGLSGKFDLHEDEGTAQQAREFGRRVRDRAEDAYSSVRERSGDLGGRVGGLARQNPMAALGIAFAVGFLLAGDGDEEDVRHPTLAKAKNQIKGAIMGGISAAISQQLRTFIEEQGGIGAILSAVGVQVPQGRSPYHDLGDEYGEV